MVDWPYNTARWKVIRQLKLSDQPLCYACQLRGQLRIATVVDHIVAVKAGGEAFPSNDGLMSLCASCHGQKTSAVDRPDRSGRQRRFKGFDVSGNPIDPLDEWNSKSRG
jgi:5-methylcytosine-specific restriction enzyme A